eukprot:m.40479 g.40479  ORF g.40479 m.40479 type:complete len:173 (-) comp18506_c1_seq2:62-580(-)
MEALNWMIDGFEIRDGIIRPKHLRTVTPAISRRVDDVFDFADAKRKGWLSREDVEVAAVALLGHELFPLDLERMFPEDMDQSTEMTREVFARKMTPFVLAVSTREEIRQLFLQFDLSCNGYISLQDFVKIVEEVSPNLSMATVVEAFRDIDTDCDGRASYHEFERTMMATVP